MRFKINFKKCCEFDCGNFAILSVNSFKPADLNGVTAVAPLSSFHFFISSKGTQQLSIHIP